MARYAKARKLASRAMWPQFFPAIVFLNLDPSERLSRGGAIFAEK